MTILSREFFWLRPDSFAAFGLGLRARRESLHLTLDALAKATGISKPYLSNIETARAPGPPSEEKLRLIARALELPADALLTGADWLRAPASMRRALAAASAGDAPSDEQSPRRADGTLNLDAMMPPRARGAAQAGAHGDASHADHSLHHPETPGIPVRNIPLINRVRAGHASEHTDLSYPAGVADQYVPAPDLPATPAASAFALRVLGESMAPEYNDGDILIVGPGEPQDGDDCVVRLGELEQFATTFKRIFFITTGGSTKPDALRLVPLNPVFPERTVSLEQVTGIYPLLYRMVPPKPRMPAGENVPPGINKNPAPSGTAPAQRGERTFTSSHISIEND